MKYLFLFALLAVSACTKATEFEAINKKVDRYQVKADCLKEALDMVDNAPDEAQRSIIRARGFDCLKNRDCIQGYIEEYVEECTEAKLKEKK